MRIRRFVLFGLGCLALLAAVPVAEAGFAAPPTGARPMGLGGAFTAIADDANAPAYNPAGLALADGIESVLTRTAFFSGATDPLVAQDAVTVVGGRGGNGFALGVTLLSDRAKVYRESIFSAGVARAFGNRFRVGVLLKRLGVGLDETNPDVAENPYFEGGFTRSRFTFDVGALASITEAWTVGLAATNLLPADLRFDTEAEEKDDVPMVMRLGTAFRLAGVAASAEQEALRGVLERSLVALDLAFGDGTVFGVGAELGLSEMFVGRIGYRAASGLGVSASAVTVGGGLRFATGGLTAQLDVALDFANTELKDNLTQRLSLRVGF